MTATEIREFREVLGLSQFEFSKLVGIERCRLSLLENGHLTPKIDEEIAIRQQSRIAAERLQVRINKVLHSQPAVA